MVQDRTKDTWGVEAREAEPIDGAVHSHERNRVHISDYAVVRHRLISHSQNPHPSKVEIIIALNFGRQAGRNARSVRKRPPHDLSLCRPHQHWCRASSRRDASKRAALSCLPVRAHYEYSQTWPLDLILSFASAF